MSDRSAPLSGWMDVLDHIERSLGESLQQTPPLPPGSAGPSDGPAALERLDGKLARWRACVERAEANAAEAEELVAGQERELADWRRQQQAARARLAAWLDQPR